MKEYNYGKFNEMFGYVFRKFLGKKFYVKMGKTGGGGLDVIKS
jgi:hypothetical protein